MASVLFSNIEDGMCSLIIDGEEFIEEGRAVIPKAVLKQLQIEDIPDDLEIEVCESKDSSMITVSVPMSFIKVGRNEFQVIYDELITRKYWDGPIGLGLMMKADHCAIMKKLKLSEVIITSESFNLCNSFLSGNINVKSAETW